MAAERLMLATEAGWLPDVGRILCLGGRLADLPLGLDRARCQIVQRFKPEAQALLSAGYDAAQSPSGRFAAAIVFAARARDLSRDRLARARAAVPAGPILVDGTKTDGIESLLSAVRKRVPVGTAISKAHGKVFRIEAGDFADWRKLPDRNGAGYVTAPGVFSADGVDRGSALLAQALPRDLSGQTADFGAGWGYLSGRVLTRPGIDTLHLVEADHDALDCARANVTDPRAQFHWADVARWVTPEPLDHVFCNPPFHVTRRADPGLGQAFLAAAARALGPRGRLWLVANRHLPYEIPLSELFGQVTELAGSAAFKVILADRPKRSRH